MSGQFKTRLNELSSILNTAGLRWFRTGLRTKGLCSFKDCMKEQYQRSRRNVILLLQNESSWCFFIGTLIESNGEGGHKNLMCHFDVMSNLLGDPVMRAHDCTNLTTDNPPLTTEVVAFHFLVQP